MSVGAQVGNAESQNPYTAELQALSIALESLAVQQNSLSAITVITANLSVLQVLHRPARQSDQGEISKTYAAKKLLDLNRIPINWL